MRVFLFFFICLFSTQLSAQYLRKADLKGKAAKNMEQAISIFQSGKATDAIRLFENVLSESPTCVDAAMYAGMASLQTKETEKAIQFFDQSLVLAPDYALEAYVELGQIYLKKKMPDKAKKYFQGAIGQPTAWPSLVASAKSGILRADILSESMADPIALNPFNLGDKVNSKLLEYLPTMTADQSRMIFTRRTKEGEDLYESHLVDGAWTLAEPLTTLNTPDNEGAQAISADGKTMVFTACHRQDGMGSCDLYISKWVKGEWTKPVNMGSPVNTAQWEAQPSLNANGTVLYFSSERSGSKERDIWVSVNRDGQWYSPIQAGKNINSAGKDESPFLHPDGKTLYFMSTGWPGLGGNDLFMSQRLEDGSWGPAKNLGYPINTEGSEGALFVTLDGKRGYYASDSAPGDESMNIPNYGGIDIYGFDMPAKWRPSSVTYVKISVKDRLTLQSIQAKVQLTADKTLPILSSTDEEGESLQVLQIGTNYQCAIEAEGYLFYSDFFELALKDNQEKVYELAILLDPIPSTATITSGPSVTLKNLFFESGSAAILPNSEGELQRLAQLLRSYPDLRIQVNGYTDNVGKEEDNQRLSEARAKSVVDYLIQKGVDDKRLRYKGYGENDPVATNDTIEGRTKNRRTTFVVIQ